jgi:protein-ribulosamine 3-kinase
MTSKIHPIFLHYLKEIEPDSEFSGSLPRIESSSGKAYYAKLGSESEAEQWAGEAEALRAMHTAAPGLAPHLLAFGTIDKSGNEVESGGRPFFVSEFLNLGQLDDKAAAKLGKRLASEMHSFKSSHGFGFAVPTYCGATRLSNGWHGSWEECFNSMVGELLGYLQDRGRFTSLCKKGRQLQNKYATFDSL